MSIATQPQPSVEEDDRLNRVFGALADPTRRSILVRLATSDATMSELAEPYEMTLAGVSKHVAVLEGAGLVTRWRTGRVRRCRMEPENVELASAWLRDQHRFWTERLDSLAEFVESVQAPGDER